MLNSSASAAMATLQNAGGGGRTVGLSTLSPLCPRLTLQDVAAAQGESKFVTTVPCARSIKGKLILSFCPGATSFDLSRAQGTMVTAPLNQRVASEGSVGRQEIVVTDCQRDSQRFTDRSIGQTSCLLCLGAIQCDCLSETAVSWCRGSSIQKN